VDYSQLSAEEVAVKCFQSGEESAWTEFILRFHPLIASVVIRITRQWCEASPPLIDDLIQDTYLKLCADRELLLQNFEPAHNYAIYGYIKVFTANLVHDHFKSARSQKRGGAAVTTSFETTEPICRDENSTGGAATLNRSVMIQQVDACLRSITPGPNGERDRRIFWLYFRVGLAAREIAALPTIGLATKGVESTLTRLTKQVRQRLVSIKSQGADPGIKGEGIHPTDSL
jgi:RNA polymerase sigma-70 factor (ECF subfamily)